MAMRRHREACATPSESLGKSPFRSRMRLVGGRRKVMTMRRIACNFPPARRAAYAISMSHDQRSLVSTRRAGRRAVVGEEVPRPRGDIRMVFFQEGEGPLREIRIAARVHVFNEQWLLGALIAAGITTLLVYASVTGIQISTEAPLPVETAPALGRLLLTTHVLPFEVASVLLLAAMVGAIILARREKE